MSADNPAVRLHRVLEALAQLSPAPASEPASSFVIPTDYFRWIDTRHAIVFSNVTVPPEFSPTLSFSLGLDEPVYGDQLASVMQVRGVGSVRLGWLFLAGRTTDEFGRERRIFQPLVSAAVTVKHIPLGPPNVKMFGDMRLSPLVTEVRDRHRIERQTVEAGGGGLSGLSVAPDLLSRMPNLQSYARSLARAAGFPKAKLVTAGATPEEFMRRDEVNVVVGLALYTADAEASEYTRAASLRRWEEKDLETPTALHALYAVGEFHEPDDSEQPVFSPLVLTPTQSSAVRRARSAPITVISGMPGTGKSHTLAAIALDAINQNQSVLIVAKTDATVDALTELLDQCPGPTPVVFGADERRRQLADRLAAGAVHPAENREIRAAQELAIAAHKHRQSVRDKVVAQLEAELQLDNGALSLVDGDDLATAALRADLVRNSLRELEQAGRFRQRSAWKNLREALDVRESVPERLRALAHEYLVSVDARRLVASGGRPLGELWDQLADSDERARNALGEAMRLETRSPARLDTKAMNAVNALAVALRAGRGVRRDHLKRLKQADITRALPLWIGTLADVDDLLPPKAGAFDLVILDEAASIDQPLAAPALLRGKRAVVAGDPRQMRQVSFVSDDDHDRAMAATGLDDDPVLCARLDVRRNSALDLAMGSVAPILLDEHFRSNPHLIDYVAHHLYVGDIRVASRRPSTHNRDCIDVVRIPGARDANGVVVEEVKEVLRQVHAYANHRSVGVITPFRAQANAIEAAVLGELSPAELTNMDLRIGTVHGFQGNERDVMIVSTGVGEDDEGSWRFVEDKALLAVMLTRAREHMVIIASGNPPERGLLAGYLHQADQPPGPPTPATKRSSSWLLRLADGLQAAGVDVFVHYPSGRHVADLVLDDERRDVAVEAEIHPKGVDSHIRRRLEMMQRGWKFEEAFTSAWLGREAELVVDLAQRLSPPDRREPRDL